MVYTCEAMIAKPMAQGCAGKEKRAKGEDNQRRKREEEYSLQDLALARCEKKLACLY